MHEFSLDYLRCVRCGSRLDLETFQKSSEIDEAFLYCTKCGLVFPVIDAIPILWNDFTNYLANGLVLGEKCYLEQKQPN